MTSLLSVTQQMRLEFSAATTRAHQSALGQFMTSRPVAAFMASLFRPTKGALKALEPGAGMGALAVALLERWSRGELGKGDVALVAHEIDLRLAPRLENALGPFASRRARIKVITGDYLSHAAEEIEKGAPSFTHAILNPPYKKIASSSEARLVCRRVGLEVVNLYAAFVGMALCQLKRGGQLVAIVPRSFCNGPYYRPFREFVLSRAALHHIHLFHSRTDAFSGDDVLQENVIVLLERGGKQGQVAITSSTDSTFSDLARRDVPFTEVVKPGNEDGFIHIPVSDEIDMLDRAPQVRSTLKELGLSVSTGPVVDFRMREHLSARPHAGTVPLLYPAHLTGRTASWPIEGFKKANAIARNADTERWLMPPGTYTVVRRFSSKEERRRVVASVVDPEALGDYGAVGFENHLNVFHRDKAGLSPALAWGLFAYLNSSAVDAHFRRFNGHTQVNATDLKALRYPTLETLLALGKWAQRAKKIEQDDIDRRMQSVLS